MKSFIIWLDNTDCFNVNWMPYLLIKFSWLSKNLHTVPIEENNVNWSCRFQCCCQSLQYNTYDVIHSSLHNAIWIARLVLLCLSNVQQCVFRTQCWNDGLLHRTNELFRRKVIISRVVWYIGKTLFKVPYYNDM